MSKTYTRDCPKCEKLVIDNDNKYYCTWGKRKKKKLIKDDRVIDKCNLYRREGIL